jgi:ribosomal protein S18 acetylase RimI-like enzyme
MPDITIKDFAGQSGFTLRPIIPSDIQSFLKLGVHTCAFMHGRESVSFDKFERNFVSFVHEYAFERESDIYVIHDPDGAHCAQLWLHTIMNRFNGLQELWIWDLTVAETYRQRGFGRALLEFAKNRAVESKNAELWLLVSSSNDRAVRLYQSVGLRIAGHVMSLETDKLIHSAVLPTFINSAVLRPLGQDDIPAIHELWRTAGLSFRPNGRDRQDRLTKHLMGNFGGGWGTFRDSKLVATALFSYDGRKGWIERLAAHPDFRRAGLAKALVTACLNSLHERDAILTAALIDSDNTASRQLFESCGFKHHPDLCYYSIRDHSDC